jgi:hypothetical protein
MGDIQNLIDRASQSRRLAIPLLIAGHGEQAAPYMTAAVMDALLALVLVQRAAESGARQRATKFGETLTALIERLPQPDMGGIPLDYQPPAAPPPEPVGPSPARANWLADRLLDGNLTDDTVGEIAGLLRDLARWLTVPAAPGAESPGPGDGGGAVPAPPTTLGQTCTVEDNLTRPFPPGVGCVPPSQTEGA